MTQYVVNVPAPPVGTDWSWTVPGIYLYDITSVSATLTTPLIPTGLAFDSSGNGRDGTYEPITGQPEFVPGLVPGNLAWLSGDANPFTTASTIQLPGTCPNWDTPWTIAWWMSFPDLPNGSGLQFYQTLNPFPDDELSIFGTLGIGGPVQSLILDAAPNSSWYAVDLFEHGTDIYFVALTWDGGDPILYVNGEVVPWTFANNNGPAASGSGGSSIGEPGAGTVNVIDEVVMYQTALSGGDIANLYLQGQAGFPYWNAAAVPLGPFGLYHLQDATSDGRQVDLIVTDGTHVVTDIPTGFGTGNSAVAYTYSWQSTLGTNTISPDGSVTSIAIPELLLPPGYTLGSSTPDLGPDDQWSDITIWWDDTHQQVSSGASDYGYPPGVTYYIPTFGAAS